MKRIFIITGILILLAMGSAMASGGSWGLYFGAIGNTSAPANGYDGYDSFFNDGLGLNCGGALWLGVDPVWAGSEFTSPYLSSDCAYVIAGMRGNEPIQSSIKATDPWYSQPNVWHFSVFSTGAALGNNLLVRTGRLFSDPYTESPAYGFDYILTQDGTANSWNLNSGIYAPIETNLAFITLAKVSQENAYHFTLTQSAVSIPVPEPSSILTLLCGIGTLGGLVLRRRSA